MRAVGLLPLVVLTGCFVANPRWQGSGEDGADGSTGSPMGDGGPDTTLGTDTTVPTTTTMPPVDSGPVEDEGETMVPVEWWDTAWRYRRRIEWVPPDTGGQVAGLPIQVEVYSLGLPNEFLEGGRDIRVVTDAGQVLSAEIDYWTEDIQEGVVWFLAPEANGSDLWLYYGNPDASEPGPANSGVFITNYVAVWHMQDNTDSTGKGHSIEASQQLPIEGYIGNGLPLDPMAGAVPVTAGPALLALSSSDFTFSAMVNPGDVQELGVLFEVSEADYPLVRVNINSELQVRITRYEPGQPTPSYVATSEDTLLGGIWSHITVRHSVNSGTQIDIDGFASGVEEDAMPSLPMVPEGEQIRVGGSINGGDPFTGLLDEVRVANVLRDDAWVLFENDAVELGLTVLGVVEERP